jgi:hypothetical protein
VKIRLLLKKFARELRSEAEGKIERQAIPFISRRARSVARQLTLLWYWQDEASKFNPGQPGASQTRAAAHETDAEDAEDEEDEEKDVSNTHDSGRGVQDFFSHIKQFLLSSHAFAKLYESLSRILRPEPLSWVVFKEQWKSEIHLTSRMKYSKIALLES